MGDMRMPDINTVFVAGRITRDPELRYSGGGVAICRASLANTRYYKDKSGSRQEQTTFINLVAFREVGEWLGELKKGTPVYIEGSLSTSEWTTTAGEKRTSTEVNIKRIQALEWEGGKKDSTPQPSDREEKKAPPQTQKNVVQDDDDVPF